MQTTTLNNNNNNNNKKKQLRVPNELWYSLLQITHVSLFCSVFCLMETGRDWSTSSIHDMEVVAGLRTSIGHLIKEVGVCSGGVATWAFNQGSGCNHAAIRLS